MSLNHPSYIRLYESGELLQRIEALTSKLSQCVLCPRSCEVNRTAGELGLCRTGPLPVVSSFNPHFGEEAPLVGRFGSGTVFLANCNLKCVFCQNYDISHFGNGEVVSTEAFSKMMISLQRRGCHNINFVTPTHQVPQIVEALPLAIEGGLEVPLVYNCGGYESVETIRLLDGIFDIYMPDLKYGDDVNAELYSGAGDYVERAFESVREMHRQVGTLELDSSGVAVRGLIIRHLVMPDAVAGTREVLGFIARELSRDSYVNIMDQFAPCYRATEYSAINRAITSAEFEEALAMARDLGLKNLAG